jgi:hypothetical protein
MTHVDQVGYQSLEKIDHALIQKILDSTRMTSEALYQIFERYVVTGTSDEQITRVMSLISR